jgi:hypothetical protein
MRFGDIDPEEVQNVSVSKHAATRELLNVFHRKIDEVVDSMYHCPMCKERFFDRKPPDSKGDCRLCRSSMKKHKIQIMSMKNDMDPFPHGYPANFPMLTPIETMLISPAYPFMKVYTFANGATGFRGQILNVQQDISDLVKHFNETSTRSQQVANLAHSQTECESSNRKRSIGLFQSALIRDLASTMLFEIASSALSRHADKRASSREFTRWTRWGFYCASTITT